MKETESYSRYLGKYNSCTTSIIECKHLVPKRGDCRPVTRPKILPRNWNTKEWRHWFTCAKRVKIKAQCQFAFSLVSKFALTLFFEYSREAPIFGTSRVLRVKLKCSLYFTTRYINFGSSSGLERINGFQSTWHKRPPWLAISKLSWYLLSAQNFQIILNFFHKNVLFTYFHVLKMVSLEILNTEVTAAVASLINGSMRLWLRAWTASSCRYCRTRKYTHHERVTSGILFRRQVMFVF